MLFWDEGVQQGNHQGIELYVLADISLREHVYAAAYCCIGVKMSGHEKCLGVPDTLLSQGLSQRPEIKI